MNIQTNRIPPFAVALAALALNPFALQQTQADSAFTTGAMVTPREYHTATLLPNGEVLVAGGFVGVDLFNTNFPAISGAELFDPASGTWTIANPLGTARYWHTATLLHNGKVLVVGGTSDGFNPLSSVELYDPATGAWTPANPLTTARWLHTATLLPSGKVLVVGGNSDSGYVGTAELYDPVSGGWTLAGTLNFARDHHTATLLPNGRVLVAGGLGSNVNTGTSAELYDPTTMLWVATGSMNFPRLQNFTATLLPNGKVLAAGGLNFPDENYSAELYDPVTGGWTLTGSLNAERQAHTAVLLPSGKVLVSGGYSYTNGIAFGNGTLSSEELYDPATGTWAFTGALNLPRNYHTATLLPSGAVLFAGGDYGPGFNAAAELYDPPGTWTVTGAMTTPRYFDTASLLPNGKVLAAGGYFFGALSSAELYEQGTGVWTATTSLITGRRLATATLLASGGVLAAGGLGSSTALSSVELYDPVAGMWMATGAMTTARYWHTASLLANGEVLVAGGEGSTGSPLSNAELYDPVARTWTVTASLSSARYIHTATMLPNGKVLVAGGTTNDAGGGWLSSAELYNPTTGAWTPTGPMNTARKYHTATLLPSGKVLVAGGSGSAPSTAELYNPVTGTWTPTGSLTTARWSHTATLLPNGKVLVAGGYNAVSQWLSSSELYDPATGAWTPTGSLNDRRSSHTATLLPSGKVLVAGGSGSAGFLASAELYDPGLGFSGPWQPQIATLNSPLVLGGSLVLNGSGFRGNSEGSSGNTQNSPANYPLVQLRSVESGQTMFLLSSNWSATSFASLPVTNFPAGWTLATVFVNGIPSPAIPLNISTPLVGAPTYDPAAGFSSLNNPNGGWSYGYSLMLGGQLILYPEKLNNNGLDEWRTNIVASGTPLVYHNPSASVITNTTAQVGPGAFGLHPGPNGEFSIARLTVPAGGPYHITGSFFGQDSVGTTTDVHILTNGIAVFSGEVTGFGPGTGPWFDLHLMLNAGDHLDFAVGYGTDNGYGFDSTGLSAQIVALVPALHIQPASHGQVVLSWPSWAPNFVVESATSLAQPIFWQTMLGVPTSAGNWLFVTNNASGVSHFFRLRQQNPIQP